MKRRENRLNPPLLAHFPNTRSIVVHHGNFLHIVKKLEETLHGTPSYVKRCAMETIFTRQDIRFEEG